MRILPVVFVWQEVDVVDEQGVVSRRHAMVPQVRYVNVAKRQYHDREEYPMVPLEARSRKSHNAYFAQVNEAFDNLPEPLAPRWPTSEHMRKWLLIETGWFDEKEFEYEGPTAKRDGRRLGTFIRAESEFARISIHAITDRKVKVIVRVAKSQSAAAMGKADFEASKKAVLEELEAMIGLARGDLKREAGRSA